ncbi:MAG: hypothetical protein EOP51_33170, partial [Sphingobacteriales bacterium]
TLTANVSNGTGTIGYQWQSGTSASGTWTNIIGATSVSYMPSASTSGTFYYKVLVTVNGSACNNANDVKTITVTTLPTATSNKTDVNCFGGATGSMSVTPAGGTAPYTYVIAGPTVNTTGASSGVFNGLAAGSYTITVTDAKGCTTTTTQNVNQPATLVVTASSNSPVCLANSLNLTTNITGGTLPFTFSWTGPNGFSSTTQNPSIANATNTAAGSYSVTITDSKGCTQSSSTSVVIQTPPVITSNAPLDTGACKNNDVSLIVAASGFPAPTVQWQVSTDNGSTWSNINGATNPTYTITNAGTNQDGWKYRAIFTNSCGSVTTNVTLLRVGAPINIGTPPPNQVGCTTNSTVTFTAAANGGNGLVVMSWQYSHDGVNWIDIPNTTT